MSQFPKKNRLDTNQLEMMITFMEEHSLFARGQIMKLGRQGHLKYKEIWTKLKNMLNKIGPSIKNVGGWQRTWNNLRKEAKRKKAKFTMAYHKTGHNDNEVDFKECYQRICQIYGTYGLGLNIVKELGFFKPHSASIDTNSNNSTIDFNVYDLIYTKYKINNNLSTFSKDMENVLSNFNVSFINLTTTSDELKFYVEKVQILRVYCITIFRCTEININNYNVYFTINSTLISCYNSNLKSNFIERIDGVMLP